MSWARLAPLLLSALAILLIAGCDPVRVETSKSEKSATAKLDPHLETQSSLQLQKFRRVLKVGDDFSVANEVFPPLSGAYAFTDPPPNLPDDFQVKGWEGRDEAFGAILYGDRVVVATRQFEEIDRTRADDLRDSILRENRGRPVESITGPNVEFWFWTENDTILMLMRRVTRPDHFTIVESLGTVDLMNFLEMSPAKAKAIVERLQDRSDAKAKEPANSGGQSAPSRGESSNS